MENTLNIQLKVTDEQIKSLLENKLENLPEDKIQEIFSNALIEFFKSPDGQSLFYTKSYYSSHAEPTPLLTRMIDHAVSKDLLKPCVDEFIESIKDKYEDLIKTTIIKTFSNLFMTEMREANLENQLHEIAFRQNNQ